MIALLSRLWRDDRGLTLPEVLMAMVITAIAVSIATTGLITVFRHGTKIEETTDASAQNRVGLELVTRLLRQATYPQWGDYANSTIVSVAEPRKIVFTGRFGTGAKRAYRFEVVDTSLLWGQSDPVCPAQSPAEGSGNPPCSYVQPTLGRTALRGLRNDVGGGICPGAPVDGGVFRYYERDATNGNLIELPNPVTGDRLARIASIQLDLFVKADPDAPSTSCQQLQTHVKLRNLQI